MPPPQGSSSPKEIDLESYISNYTGHTKIRRLQFIAERSPELQVEALKMAIDELKNTMNVSKYREITDLLGVRGGPEYVQDIAWIESQEKKATLKSERLEMELNGYKTNLIKESIRMGHNDLGDFHYERGDLNSALKCYARSRDYCTTPKHMIGMCLNVIKVSIEMSNFTQVLSYVSKAEQTPELTDRIILSKLRCCAGLAHIESSKYKVAASKFLETTFDISNHFSEIISPQDIAVYGSLCALATFDRQDLKLKVLDSTEFKNFLELVPEVRELIKDFYASRYASCLSYLDKLKNELLLDIHLHDHITALSEKIRNKALIQYSSPFVSIDLRLMASSFNTTVPALEQELSHLIMDSSIQARIDSHNKVLYARHTDQRNLSFEKAVKMGQEYERNTKGMLLRMNLLKNDFIIKPPRYSKTTEPLLNPSDVFFSGDEKKSLLT